MEESIEPLTADPVVVWPQLPDLGELQRCNPELELRHALDDRAGEVLVYAGNGTGPVTIALPQPPSDDFLAGLTERNRDWSVRQTDIGPLRCAPLRVERTVGGKLFIRPRSWDAERAMVRFARACQLTDAPAAEQRRWIDCIMRVVKSWGMLRPDGEIWEVDYAYMPDGMYYRPDGLRKSTREFWETVPIGVVSFIDAGDVPIAEHRTRAIRIIASGSLFAVVADVRSGGAAIFRASGSEFLTGTVGLPEMPWFSFPV